MWCFKRFFRFAAVGLALTAGLTAAVVADAATSVVTDVRIGSHGSATRVVFELTEKVTFTTFALAGPNRVVIDLPEVGWRLPPQPLPGATGVFGRLRYGLFKPGNSRVVLEVQKPSAITQAFLLAPDGGKGYRLVIDLSPITQKTFNGNIGKAPIKVTSTSPQPKPQLKTALPALAPPISVSHPSVKTPLKNAVLAPSKPASQQASPFRMAPRKPQPKRPGQKHVIMIDPGHGGVDPGTIGISGIYEKHVTLSMARELKKQFEETGRFKVMMTRDRDIFIRLRDRVQVSRDAKAELFISIHADTVKNRAIKGPAVYTLSEKASDREAAELADKENKADLIAGVDLTHETPEVTNILIDLAQRESMNQSARFATSLIKELKRKTKVLRNTHRFAGFAVLKAPDIPSVLMELGFLSNPEDERALRSRHYRARLAGAVVRAAEIYFARVEEANRK